MVMRHDQGNLATAKKIMEREVRGAFHEVMTTLNVLNTVLTKK